MAEPETTQPARRGTGVFFGFVPWIIFDVVAGPSTWKLAAFTALIAAILLSVPEFRRGHARVLEVTGLVFFAVVSILSLVLGRKDLLWLETYAQPLSNGIIAVVALGSLAFTPFTESYARESVAPEFWNSRTFKHTNRVLTAVWGGVFVVNTLLGLLAVHTRLNGDWLNWVLPVLLIVFAVKFTSWYASRVRERTAHGVR
ncbi:hypothetical protein AB0B01_10620 [Streptomyces sp. NPDC044571]|uniref:hypothetical protein n=1 Tax=Streptomyces sp. NPDC044571 TaxID=3155371 RepID=UPI0033FC3AED